MCNIIDMALFFTSLCLLSKILIPHRLSNEGCKKIFTHLSQSRLFSSKYCVVGGKIQKEAISQFMVVRKL